MKQGEIKKCVFCKKGMMHDGHFSFYRLTLDRLVVNTGAVQRQHGLEMILGNAAIAHVMGTNEDIAQSIGDKIDVLICEDCAIKPERIASIYELVE